MLTRQASVQFIEPITVRVIRVHDWYTYVGWCWLDVYTLNRVGDAVERRSLFVQIAGLRPATSIGARTAAAGMTTGRSPANAGVPGGVRH